MSISTLASLGMAIGAPLVYADQAYSIYRKKDATGFSHDVCAVLLIANITRCFFWLGERFEFALLLQSWLMIGSQLGLLYLCLRFRPITRNSKSISSDGRRVVFEASDEESQGAEYDRYHVEEDEDDVGPNKKPLLDTLGINVPFLAGSSSRYGVVSQEAAPEAATGGQGWKDALKKGKRPLNFWQWQDYQSYLVFLGFYVVLLAVLYLILGGFTWFVSTLGYVALGLESTLPVPQLITNQRRRSLAGFRASVLIGWLGGDSFKLLYFILRSSPLQFTVCAVFQLSIDLMILAQSWAFRENTVREEEERVKAAEEARAANGQAGIADVERHHHGGGGGEIEPDESGDIGDERGLSR